MEGGEREVGETEEEQGDKGEEGLEVETGGRRQ